ncbi:50S ribosomal protein L9 [Blattabacterium cuenoti]
MKILLKKDIEKLGFKYDELEVRAGYARNYLFPKGLAVLSSCVYAKRIKETLKNRFKNERILIEKSNYIKKKIQELNIKIPVKVSKNGKLFGSINNQKIMEILNSKGINIDKKFIKITGNKPIKSIGKYQAIICIHRKHSITLSFEVLSDS